MMDLMKQIEIWNQDDEQQRIINTIEAMPEEERTPQIISALARAYNNVAGVDDSPLLHKAIALLQSVSEDLQDDYSWNFRMAYAYYYLNQEGDALRFFERAMDLKPDNTDTQWFIDDCRERLALPLFEKTFRERTAEGWASFLEGEAELVSMMEKGLDSGRLMERCADLLSPAFADIAFQLGFNGGKYELVLSPEGSRAKLFTLIYFQRHAPAQILQRWNVLIGRQPSVDFSLRMYGQDISAGDVQAFVGDDGNGRASLSFYCEKLLPLLQENEGEAYRFLSVLLDQAVGELSVMELVDDIQLLEDPAQGQYVPLQGLAQYLQEQGYEWTGSAEEMLEQYTAYEMEPEEGGEADLRLDVFAGVTRCPPFINEYLQGASGWMDAFHRDGAVPGFFYYPLDCFAQTEGRGKLVLDFREGLEAAVSRQAGEDAVVFIGGASGIHYGYLDFIAWDLQAVLKAAAEAFEQSPVAWAAFHTFRRDVGGVSLKNETEDTAE